MSVLASHNHEIRRRAAAARVRAVGRSRRAGEGSIAELARQLAREARASERHRLMVISRGPVRRP